jgi:outer membrane protein assembly factor BamC
MNLTSTPTPIVLRRVAIATLSSSALALAGCSSLGEMFSGDKIDYKTSNAKTAPLEVPPDLSQLARDGRYQPQGGVVSASTVGLPATAATPSAAAAVAVTMRGDARVERQGQQRWLVVPQTPEQLWPLLRQFWVQRGFKLSTDDAQLGVMETDWSENRAKLPNDIIRNTIGRVFGNLYDTGERDRFRTRVERTATGSEVFISHRGAEEAYLNNDRRDEGTRWRFRASDPQLEAEFLTRLLVSLGTKDEPARTLVASAPESPARARSVAGKPAATMEVDEPFDRAWRRVGLALDRSGFTVEDRDRAAGLYYVRYINPANAGKEEPGWWARLFGDNTNPQAAVRYRIQVQGGAERTTISVLSSAGAPEAGDDGKRIVAVLVGELK